MPRLTAEEPAARYTVAPGMAFWSTLAAPARRGKAADATAFLAADKTRFRDLLVRVDHAPPVQLFDHVEAGVPASVVDAIAKATGWPQAELQKRLGLPTTTLKRKANDLRPLPPAQGHRVVGFLAVAAKVKRMLDESGDAEALRHFDPEAWLMQWMDTTNPSLGGRTPFEMLKNPVGQRVLEDLLERMRSGVAA